MQLKIAFVGMGNVARAFAKILEERRESLAEQYGLEWKTIGIATRRHGAVICETGIDLTSAVNLLESGGRLTELPNCTAAADAREIIRSRKADLIFETTPLNPKNAQPALEFITLALQRGISVITANKGPVAFAYEILSSIAETMNVCFRFEGTVMDGAPVFNLAEYCLPGAKILGFSGVLNSTTNIILTGMESGRSFNDCLAEAQRMGIAEANPDYDIDGWDAAMKAVALANVLMDADMSPELVQPQGIRGVTAEDLADAMASGKTIRLVASATRSGDAVNVRVGPERVPLDSLFGSMRGASNVLVLETDLMKELAIVERDPDVRQTAYALLSDMIRVHETLSSGTLAR